MKKIYLLLIFGLLSLGVTAQNLVLNPGFEDWEDVNNPTSWIKAENVDQESTEVHSGTYSAKHTGGTSDLTQDIEVVSGTEYTLSFWYKVVENDGTDARIWCVWLDESGSGMFAETQAEIRGPDGGYLPNGAGEWQQYTATVTAPAGAAKLSLEVRTYSGAVTYWDDFSLEAIEAMPTHLFFSEYIEGSSNNKALEIYNPTGATVDLSSYQIAQSSNGGGWEFFHVFPNEATLGSQEVYVIITDQVSTDLFDAANADEVLGWPSVVHHNGNDARALVYITDIDTTILDIIGDPDNDPGSGWDVAGVAAATANHTLVRKDSLTMGTDDWSLSAGTDADNSQWVVYDQNYFTDLGFYGVDPTPPVWEAGYPAAANVEDVQFDLNVQLDKPSMVYYVVLEDGATEPTVEEVIAGTGSAGAAAHSAGSFEAGISETSMTITGLNVETSYDIYVVAENMVDPPSAQDAVSLVEVTTVVMPDVLYLVDFASDLAPFTAFSAAGATKEWAQSNGYAEMNGYNSGEAEVDWLISPEYNLTGVTSAILNFSTAWRFGTYDDTHFMKLLYSEDYDGNTANIGTATWTEITFQIPSEDTWTDIKGLDLSAITGTVYFAFAYDYPDNYTRWRVDNFEILGFAPAGSDATLSDLTVDATTVAEFDPAKLSYTLELAAGTTTVPTVDYTVNDENASATVTPASDLTGDAAARTTTVEVTAQDGTTTQTYSVVFNPILEVANLGELRASADESRKYVITGEVLISFQQSYRNKKYVQDATGGVEIDDDPGIITTVYSIGDGISGLEGTIEDYNGLLQFHPTSDPGATTSTGNTITPTVATPAQINADIDAYESTLVTVQSGTIDEADGTTTFANGDNLTLNGAAESMVLRVHFYSTTLNDVVIPDSANITGIVVEFNGTAQIAPRSADDVEVLIEYIPSDVATLDDLMVDEVSVAGFSPAQLSYFVNLPTGYDGIPSVTADATDENAQVDVDPVTDLSGDAAARTATVTVTAEDGATTKTYTIEFTVGVGISIGRFDAISVYPVPTSETLFVENSSEIDAVTVYDITGTAVKKFESLNVPVISIDVADLQQGVYLLKLQNKQESAIVRFIVK